jgi:phosphate transport system protein
MNDFDDAIADLNQKLLTMGSQAEAAVHRSIKAILNRDDGLASSGREVDKDIDDLEIEIDEQAIGLLPRARTPEELRRIIVVTKIARNLERVGDEATTISRRAFELNRDAQAEPSFDIAHRAELAVGMLKEALDAFVEADPRRARMIIPRDKEVDSLNRELHRELTEEIMRTPGSAPRCLNLMVVSKSLERIGDHAKNIAEDVVYLYEGRDIRHTGRGKVRPAEPIPPT